LGVYRYDWYAFDNMRGGGSNTSTNSSGSSSSLNRDCTDGVLGVCITGTQPSWTSNPLNMVNYYAYGRLAWDPTLTPKQIHTEWTSRTFGNASGAVSLVQAHGGGSGDSRSMVAAALASIVNILHTSESAADKLSFYRGYRGLWYYSSTTYSSTAPSTATPFYYPFHCHSFLL
jgi:hypothetical protein